VSNAQADATKIRAKPIIVRISQSEIREEEFPGANHFTVIDPLSDPQSDMIRRVVELTQVAKA
jgi:hypothetical protein